MYPKKEAPETYVALNNQFIDSEKKRLYVSPWPGNRTPNSVDLDYPPCSGDFESYESQKMQLGPLDHSSSDIKSD